MKVAGWGGFILALPVVLWQVWRFIVPGLESKEKRYARPVHPRDPCCCSCSVPSSPT